MAGKTKTYIRWMIRRDLPEVLAIELNSFDVPWTEEEFLNCLRKRNCIGMVATPGSQDNDGPVIGYMIYTLHKNHLDVANFAVDPEYRHQGVGSKMVAKLFSKLTTHRRQYLTLTLPEGNVQGQLFFRSQGFRATSIVSGAYDDGTDAYKMHLPVDQEFELAWGEELPVVEKSETSDSDNLL